MTEPTEADLNALDITPGEAAEINAISHPLLADPAPDANDDLVQIDSTADGVVFVTINRPDKRNAFDAPTIAALYEAFEGRHLLQDAAVRLRPHDLVVERVVLRRIAKTRRWLGLGRAASS